MNLKKEVSTFYDSFTANQTKIGVSVRHRLIFKKLKKIGLKRNSNVLEIGCGIGTVSGLIVDFCRDGYFTGVDISPKSIEIARATVGKRSNADFICSDMSDFSSETKFDFIVFPDVLEHIPEENHNRIFQLVSQCSKPSTKVLINIPEPESLNWIRKNQPEKLQIIDQSLSMQKLINSVYEHGFKLESLIPYSIHMNVNNYLSIVLYREREIQSIEIRNKIVNFIQNIAAKL